MPLLQDEAAPRLDSTQAAAIAIVEHVSVEHTANTLCNRYLCLLITLLLWGAAVCRKARSAVKASRAPQCCLRRVARATCAATSFTSIANESCESALKLLKSTRNRPAPKPDPPPRRAVRRRRVRRPAVPPRLTLTATKRAMDLISAQIPALPALRMNLQWSMRRRLLPMRWSPPPLRRRVSLRAVAVAAAQAVAAVHLLISLHLSLLQVPRWRRPPLLLLCRLRLRPPSLRRQRPLPHRLRLQTMRCVHLHRCWCQVVVQAQAVRDLTAAAPAHFRPLRVTRASVRPPSLRAAPQWPVMRLVCFRLLIAACDSASVSIRSLPLLRPLLRPLLHRRLRGMRLQPLRRPHIHPAPALRCSGLSAVARLSLMW